MRYDLSEKCNIPIRCQLHLRYEAQIIPIYFFTVTKTIVFFLVLEIVCIFA